MSEKLKPSSEEEPTINLPEIDRRLKALKRFEADLKNEEVDRARVAMQRTLQHQQFSI